MFKLPARIWLFTSIQALAMSAGTMMVLVGGVLGAKLAPTSDLATLPVAVMIVGTAIGVLPVTRLMGRFGRRPIFIGVAVMAMLASLLASLAATQQSFYGFLISSFLIGFAVAGFQQIRFAAMESVSIELAPKAASTVLLGGLIAAFIGPELATQGRSLTSQDFAGTFILMSVVCGLCAVLFSRTTETHVKTPKEDSVSASIKPVLSSPLFIIAVSSSVIGYALMSFIMTATPVHMHVIEHHSLEHTKWVIQSHIVAMFLPSFISGWLISMLGVSKVIALGLFAYLLTITFSLIGSELVNYWSALVLLGIGWNFLFLGGTVLLPRTHSNEQKIRIQGMHELLVFTAQGVAALGAGVMLYGLGWQGLMFASLVVVCGHMLLLAWQTIRLRTISAKVATENV